MEILINEQLAQKVKETVDFGLCSGVGKPIPGQMCVEAAVNYACRLPHGDNPSCVGKAVRSFKIRLNDAKWSSNNARAKGMLKIAIAQLGSNTIDQQEFAKIVAFKTITTLMPVILRDREFETEAVLCEGFKDLKEAKDNIWSVKSKLYIATYPAAYIAANIAAAYYADIAAYYTVDAADVDKYLIISAEICLDALIELNSPGVQFLYLCKS